MGHMVKYPDRRDGSTLFDFYGNIIAQGIAGLAFTAKGDIPVGTGVGTGVMQAVGANGQVLTADSTQVDGVRWATPASPGTGTVTSVSVISANGLAGTVATPTTTPAITLSTSITGILKGSGTAITAATAGTDYTTPTGTEGLSNKRVTRRVTVINAPGATPTYDTDNLDILRLTGLATAITSMTTNATGTPLDGDSLVLMLTDNGSPQTIAWGANFESSTVALPTTTVAGALLTVGCFWNTVTSKWRCDAVA